MKKQIAAVIKDFCIYLVLCIATFLMLRSISQYVTFNTNVGFLQVKQDYIHIPVWKAAFYIHVFSSIFTLLAGFSQFSNFVLTQHRKLHRIVGKIYAYNIMLINFPAGLIMAYYANGFLPSKIAFLILDFLWFGFTVKAVAEIRRKNVKAHKNYMIRSYALTFSAITLRTWKLVLSSMFNIEPVTLYMIDAWLGFVPNLLFAEWLIYKNNQPKLSPKRNHTNDYKEYSKQNEPETYYKA
jgi:hypothetical protein